ncbi:hypothetical protein FSP39_022410 [Pinctada imbricata]|uniref:G-protein coupled receptors family 2 profile 2 domain-containing protein n=1 Tax=Pinctada imbricata TaxID=66713 RepID=A0AA89CBH9_PINIB|nr:hypothetical protein FSP39_022410 [Pinctada imbricata]
MAHLVSLFLSQTLIQFGLLDISYMPLCLAYGITLHYSWLCTFFTLNICCFHIFRIFSDISFAKVVSTRRHRQHIIYLLYSFGVPLILVSINVIYNLQRNNHLGYRYPSCFISNWLSNIVTFTAPVGLITIVDLILFVFTTRNLNSTKHSRAMALSSDNHTVNREHFKVYLKTFFLSGATWILSLVDMFMPITILTYFTVILNSSQGVFLFVIYICNKNVLTSYRKRLTDVFQRSTSSSDPRTMSTSDK